MKKEEKTQDNKLFLLNCKNPFFDLDNETIKEILITNNFESIGSKIDNLDDRCLNK